MYQGNRALRDKLLAMTPDEIRAYWTQGQERKRDAGEAYHTTLYAAATGPNAGRVVAQVEATR